MTALLVGEARQAEWMETDDWGQPVTCVTNTVKFNAGSVCLLGGGQDRPQETTRNRVERSEWWTPFGMSSITFLGPERPEVRAFEREYAAFAALKPQLTANYHGLFVAVHNGTIVDADISRAEVVRRFFARFGDVSVYVGYVGTPPMAYQLTPFRI